MADQITKGALDAIFNEPDHAQQQFPVPILQCLQIKTLDSKNGAAGTIATERFRIVLSDLKNYVQCMMATQTNHLVHDGLLQRGCIVRLKQYQAQCLKGKKHILIVLDLEVIQSLGCPEKIGDPQPLGPRSAEPAQNTGLGSTNFYGGVKSEPTQDTKPQFPRQMPSRNAGGGQGSSTIYPIEGLSQFSHKWTIKARVTSKSDIKTWHKASGEGKLFSVNLLDESGEIRATGFNDQVDQFYDLLQEGQVYYISTPCRVQLAKKQFSNLPNDYELTFERDTVIEKAEDQSSVPQVRFNFVNIQELQDVEKDATVDVIGVLKEVAEVTHVVSKTTQKPYDKRELTLVDNTGYSVRCTIWGKIATNFDAQPESIVAFKGTKVSDFGGRSLSLLSSGTMAIDPDIPEAHHLKGWYDSAGRNNTFATHNNMQTLGGATGRKDDTKTISQVKEENLGTNEMPDFFSLKATVVYIKQDSFAYPACRSEGCNRKVTDMNDGTWRCEKCQVNHDRPQYRYILNVNVNDHTGQLWLSCFDDTARVIMGKSADELMQIRENDETRLAEEFAQANCRKLNFRCRARMDTFGEQQRVRYQVMSAVPLDYKMEGNKLNELINAYNQMSM